MRAARFALIIVAAAFVGIVGTAAASDLADRISQLEQENARLRADAEFARRRMALLEQEADRLRVVVKARQDADDLASNRARRQEIEREVARIRSLNFQRPVDYHEIPRAELPAILRQKLAQQVPDQEFDAAGTALAALGVLPAGTDLKKTYLALLGEQIGAFYDQHEKGLFTFSGQGLGASTNRVIMAHELTHALEDQHFDLSRLPIEARGNDDRVLATTALVEGDATLVMNRYMAGDLSAASVREALGSALTTDVRQLASAPRYLRETLLFPYLHGQEFCNTLYGRGGWETLNEAFRHPPSSSAQILHPELYLADPREEPVAVRFDDPKIDGQEPAEDNVLGEFGTRQLFATWLHDQARAEEAARGWRGDRYLVYQSPSGTSYGWKVICRDPEAAERFYQAACDVNAARYRPGQTTGKEVAPAPFQSTPGQARSLPAARIVRSLSFAVAGRAVTLRLVSNNEVLVVDAQDARWFDALTDKLMPASSLTP